MEVSEGLLPVPGAKSRSSSKSGERYRRLPTGAHGIDPEEVKRDQRERLQNAIVELIAERGYQAVRILDLTKLARVSRPTFYSLYDDKEELFLAAYDEIAGQFQPNEIAALVSLIVTINAWNAIGVSTRTWAV